MRALILSASLLLAAIAFAPGASAAGPCVFGSADNCVLEFVVCVQGPCEPRSPLAEKILGDFLPGWCEPPFECYP